MADPVNRVSFLQPTSFAAGGSETRPDPSLSSAKPGSTGTGDVSSSSGRGGPARGSGLNPSPLTASSVALERRLGLVDLILLGIGASIGSGIFVVTGIAAKQAGPAVVLSFAIAGLASVFDALCYAELSARFPGLVGGAYLYTYATFGELGAFCLFCHLMFDYHIGAASIARSLASYLARLVQAALGPSLPLPALIAPGGLALLGGLFSINLVAPVILISVTWLLTRGVRESAAVNGVLTSLKVVIVIVVVLAGSTVVQPGNWVPFVPNGGQSIFAAASVVFFSYIGFDAVANTAEESKNPHRDVPIGILVSLSVCAILYIAVCLVLTGMVPYADLDPSAPLSAAFAARGLLWLEAVIDVGAVAGLTTTLVAGLYVQARMYLAIARDGLLPSVLSRVEVIKPFPPRSKRVRKASIDEDEARQSAQDKGQRQRMEDGVEAQDEETVQLQEGEQEASKEEHHIPMNAQLWAGALATVLAALFDVSRLSHVLSVGVLLSYSTVCICVPILRLDAFFASFPGRSPNSSADTNAAASGVSSAGFEYQSLLSASVPPRRSSNLKGNVQNRVSTLTVASSMRWRALTVIGLVASLSLLLGLAMRFPFPLSPVISTFLLLCLIVSISQLHFLPPHSTPPEGFSCPLSPWLPILGMVVNVYLVSQMHPAAWLRLVILTAAALGFFWVFEKGRPRKTSALCSAAACGRSVLSNISGVSRDDAGINSQGPGREDPSTFVAEGTDVSNLADTVHSRGSPKAAWIQSFWKGRT